MRKESFSSLNKRKKPTSVELEESRAKTCYEVLLKEGHKTEFQLRKSIGGISSSTFYKMNQGVFAEEPYNTLIAVVNGLWYTPQREHFDKVKDEWILNKNFVEESETVEKTE